MNYLAHILISGSSFQVQVGGFIADAVKGSYINRYPKKIAEGIRVHREVDHFTDHHPLILQEIALMRPHFGRYAPMLLDMFLDHILASEFRTYYKGSLRLFSFNFYAGAIMNYKYIPLKFKRFLAHFILTNRLTSYRSTEGIRDSLNLLLYARQIPVDTDDAISYLEKRKPQISHLFSAFFNELRAHIEQDRIKHTLL